MRIYWNHDRRCYVSEDNFYIRDRKNNTPSYIQREGYFYSNQMEEENEYLEYLYRKENKQ